MCFAVAPIKALCSERFEDWSSKFGRLGLRCCELTGDSQLDDYFELQNSQIIMTTPVSYNNHNCTCTCMSVMCVVHVCVYKCTS